MYHFISILNTYHKWQMILEMTPNRRPSWRWHGLCFSCRYHLYHMMTGYVGWPPVKDPVEEGKAYSWRFSEEEIRGMTNSLRLSCTWQGSYMKGSLFEKCNLIYPASSALISYFLFEDFFLSKTLSYVWLHTWNRPCLKSVISYILPQSWFFLEH